MSNAIRLSVLSSFTARCRCCVVYPSKHRAIPIAAHPRRVRHPHRRTRSLHGRSALPFPRIAPLRSSTNDTGLAARSGRVCKAVKFPPGYDYTEKLFPCGFLLLWEPRCNTPYGHAAIKRVFCLYKRPPSWYAGRPYPRLPFCAASVGRPKICRFFFSNSY